jgi:uncharacterized RDD family membrane protein YckC
MSGDLYVKSVIDHVPYGLPLREQLAMELRGLIAERVSHGQPLEEILQQLGDPLTLAESYLSAIPLNSAGLWRRIAAKAIDLVLVFGIAAAIATALFIILRPEGFALGLLPGLSVLGATFGYVVYTVIAEYRTGRTLGKRLMGIRVVRESGARISLGQSMLRQVPFLGQFIWIDALFALFNERRQRGFEILTKTRAIALLMCIATVAGPGA